MNTDILHGTFACPICGHDKPHGHDQATIDAYQSDQIRRDGWASTIIKRPSSSRFYLCRGHKVPDPAGDSSLHYLHYQRLMSPYLDAEVLWFEAGMQRFSLLHCIGNAVASGAEARRQVFVEPTHWMEIPKFDEPSDLAALRSQLAGSEAVLRRTKSALGSLQINSSAEIDALTRQLAAAKAGAAIKTLAAIEALPATPAAVPISDEFADIFSELAKATAKFPTWPTDPLHALAVLGEEFGELTKDVLQLTYEPHKTSRDNARKEALQTAAMALRFYASLDRYEYAQGAQHEQSALATRPQGEK